MALGRLCGAPHRRLKVTVGVCLIQVHDPRAVVRLVEDRVVIVVGIARVTEFVVVRVRLVGVPQARTVVFAVRNTIVVVVVTPVAVVVAVGVGLVDVCDEWAVVVRIGNAVAVLVVVTQIAESVGVGVLLIGIRNNRTVVVGIEKAVVVIVVVARVACPVPVDIFLVRVGDHRAVVIDIQNGNFVFGQASLTGRVDVFSFARLDPTFEGKPASRRLLMRRSLAILVHEVGHMFGITHCTHYSCTMNGSNSLDESDRQPLRLCPVCLRKVQWATKAPLADRYRALADLSEEMELDQEAAWFSGRTSLGGDLQTQQPRSNAPNWRRPLHEGGYSDGEQGEDGDADLHAETLPVAEPNAKRTLREDAVCVYRLRTRSGKAQGAMQAIWPIEISPVLFGSAMRSSVPST
ncbi:MAG: putative Zn-dependent protease [Myxococcota bacterium]